MANTDMTHTIQLKSLNLIGETTCDRSEDDIIIRVISDLTLLDNNFKNYNSTKSDYTSFKEYYTNKYYEEFKKPKEGEYLHIICNKKYKSLYSHILRFNSSIPFKEEFNILIHSLESSNSNKILKNTQILFNIEKDLKEILSSQDSKHDMAFNVPITLGKTLPVLFANKNENCISNFIGDNCYYIKNDQDSTPINYQLAFQVILDKGEFFIDNKCSTTSDGEIFDLIPNCNIEKTKSECSSTIYSGLAIGCSLSILLSKNYLDSVKINKDGYTFIESTGPILYTSLIGFFTSGAFAIYGFTQKCDTRFFVLPEILNTLGAIAYLIPALHKLYTRHDYKNHDNAVRKYKESYKELNKYENCYLDELIETLKEKEAYGENAILEVINNDIDGIITFIRNKDIHFNSKDSFASEKAEKAYNTIKEYRNHLFSNISEDFNSKLQALQKNLENDFSGKIFNQLANEIEKTLQDASQEFSEKQQQLLENLKKEISPILENMKSFKPRTLKAKDKNSINDTSKKSYNIKGDNGNQQVISSFNSNMSINNNNNEDNSASDVNQLNKKSSEQQKLQINNHNNNLNDYEKIKKSFKKFQEKDQLQYREESAYRGEGRPEENFNTINKAKLKEEFTHKIQKAIEQFNKAEKNIKILEEDRENINEMREKIQNIIQNNVEELKEDFYKKLLNLNENFLQPTFKPKISYIPKRISSYIPECIFSCIFKEKKAEYKAFNDKLQENYQELNELEENIIKNSTSLKKVISEIKDLNDQLHYKEEFSSILKNFEELTEIIRKTEILADITSNPDNNKQKYKQEKGTNIKSQANDVEKNTQELKQNNSESLTDNKQNTQKREFNDISVNNDNQNNNSLQLLTVPQSLHEQQSSTKNIEERNALVGNLNKITPIKNTISLDNSVSDNKKSLRKNNDLKDKQPDTQNATLEQNQQKVINLNEQNEDNANKKTNNIPIKNITDEDARDELKKMKSKYKKLNFIKGINTMINLKETFDRFQKKPLNIAHVTTGLASISIVAEEIALFFLNEEIQGTQKNGLYTFSINKNLELILNALKYQKTPKTPEELLLKSSLLNDFHYPQSFNEFHYQQSSNSLYIAPKLMAEELLTDHLKFWLNQNSEKEFLGILKIGKINKHAI